ncbi:glycoside hydrolase family 12 protein [Boletus reticuloceps]|uniref:Glycoside hydrolase family 12 protein n=1 Tax=Boletus reticuloceps TaxID=495285 RepID=A0A8I2YTP0_9AGAM|nr:glycoside hydrolase family 12 protein [Boletus reticuloceps]
MISWLTLLLLLPLISSFPLRHRANTVCDKFESVPSGSYSLLNNLWGESSATSGRQCSTLKSVNGNTVSWSTEWAWSGGYDVKSFANIQLNEGVNQQLSAITSMPSTWHWSQSANETVMSDVSYDLFTSDSPHGKGSNEIMIWLANYNAGPISYKYNANGKSVPIAIDLSIAGHTWNLHAGWNGYNKVWSFVPTSGPIHSFKGDIYGFFTYLTGNGDLSSSDYLVVAQAGTEATTGSAIFKTSAYALSIY